MNLERTVKQAKSGNEEAFWELMQMVSESLYRTAFRYFGNEHDALDAVQEVACKALLKIGTLRKESHFKAWILRMMINHCHDVWQKQKRMIPVEEIFEKPYTSKKETDQLVLQDLLSHLEPDLQEIIHLKYFEDWTIKQIAAWRKVPEGTVKTWLNRALKSLRVEWQKGEEEIV